MQLETKYAGEIIAMLEEAQDVGINHVVFPLVPTAAELKPQHFVFFDTLGYAMEYLESKAPYYEPRGPGQMHEIHYRRVDALLDRTETSQFIKKRKRYELQQSGESKGRIDQTGIW
ncbi:hypothetical protein ACQ86K_12955 [Mucilaginibacter sp. P19]|uniref:hypothetical protein n=1 Tax=Mucilaginibacter sp. P19 TaxID=3423947 RepID=UPI003D66584E